jgi:hypothetical protein
MHTLGEGIRPATLSEESELNDMFHKPFLVVDRAQNSTTARNVVAVMAVTAAAAFARSRARLVRGDRGPELRSMPQ